MVIAYACLRAFQVSCCQLSLTSKARHYRIGTNAWGPWGFSPWLAVSFGGFLLIGVVGFQRCFYSFFKHGTMN